MKLSATRERMVELMREGEVKPTVSDVLTRLTAAALMRHRAVNAHFVEGRIHRFTLRRKPLREAEQWLARHQAFWRGAVAQLDRLLSETDDAS